MRTLRSQGRSTCGLVPTLEQRADPPPARDAALVGVLSQRRLQEEQRHATREHEEDVRDEENAWEEQQLEQKDAVKLASYSILACFFLLQNEKVSQKTHTFSQDC